MNSKHDILTWKKHSVDCRGDSYNSTSKQI